MMRILSLALLVLLVLGGPEAPVAQAASSVDWAPNEVVETVTDPELIGTDRLQTTVFRPRTPGPWPLVVLNHGNLAYPNHHDEPRWRPGGVANFFVEQGYLVIAPMRRGYAGSSGTFEYNCDPLEFGDRAADDVEAAIRFYERRHEAKPGEVLVIGGSQGGWVTLAYASKYSDARGVINLDGGVAYPVGHCRVGWEQRLIAAGRVIGAKAKVPSLWMYADDSEIFPPSVSRPFFKAYLGGGGRATLVTVPTGGHSFMWGNHRNEEAWHTTVERFIHEVGLPTPRFNPIDAKTQGLASKYNTIR